jgi:uncharacterized membrane protein
MTGVSVLFSLNYIISKIGLHAFHPLTFAWLRVAASAIIINVLFRERDAAPLAPGDGWRLAGFAILGVVINQSLFLAGLAFTTAHVASILITTIPVFALGAAIVIGRERPTAAKIGGIALAAAGALVVVGGEGFAGTMKSLVGDVLIIGNSLAYALYLVFSKPAMARLSARRVIARMFAVGTVVMLPIRVADDARVMVRDPVKSLARPRPRHRGPDGRGVSDERVGAEVRRQLRRRRVHVPPAGLHDFPGGDLSPRADPPDRDSRRRDDFCRRVYLGAATARRNNRVALRLSS